MDLSPVIISLAQEMAHLRVNLQSKVQETGKSMRNRYVIHPLNTGDNMMVIQCVVCKGHGQVIAPHANLLNTWKSRDDWNVLCRYLMDMDPEFPIDLPLSAYSNENLKAIIQACRNILNIWNRHGMLPQDMKIPGGASLKGKKRNSNKITTDENTECKQISNTPMTSHHISILPPIAISDDHDEEDERHAFKHPRRKYFSIEMINFDNHVQRVNDNPAS